MASTADGGFDCLITPLPRCCRADFDFGVGVLQQHMTNFAFPWLLSNVLDATTMQPLGGAQRSVIIPWEGVNVGLLGLVERDW